MEDMTEFCKAWKRESVKFFSLFTYYVITLKKLRENEEIRRYKTKSDNFGTSHSVCHQLVERTVSKFCRGREYKQYSIW